MRKTLVHIIPELKLVSLSWKNYHFLWNFSLTVFKGQTFIKTEKNRCVSCILIVRTQTGFGIKKSFKLTL